jgi:DNA replication initiation complex subunit (GINS family)
MDKINITYDSLFETLMNEKNKDSLQKLSLTFFTDLVAYVAEKRKTLENPATDPFAMEEKEATSKQLQNITRMVRELYERRERKIITMATIRSRTGADIIDTSGLLVEEQMLFDAVVAQLDYYRNSILHATLEARTPAPEAPVPDGPQKETKLIRFLFAVPKFVGKELEIYGPFEEEDVASLPVEIADILVSKGRAEELEGET